MCRVSFRVQVITAEGEHRASHSLRQAAEVIGDSKAAMQVKEDSRTSIIGVIFLAALPSHPQHHLRGEEQHHRVPHPHGHRQQVLLLCLPTSQQCLMCLLIRQNLNFSYLR